MPSDPRGANAHTDAWRDEQEEAQLALDPLTEEATSAFLEAMAAVGNPGLRDRQRRKRFAAEPVKGWALSDHQYRFGTEPYWVVSTDSKWWFYDPEWDRDKHPETPAASLRRKRPSAGQGASLLDQALVGYGAVSPADDVPPLAICADPHEAVQILTRAAGSLFSEAILVAWPRLVGNPGFPPATHDLIEVQGLGSRFGRYRFRTGQRWRAWFAGASTDTRTWVDEVGLAWYEAERKDRWIPTERRNAGTLAIVAPGADFQVKPGYPEPVDSVVIRTRSTPAASVLAARNVLATM